MPTTSAPTQPEPWGRALLVSLPALAFLLGCFPMADFDVWWHLRTGQLILETHTVPHVDLFTYTNATRPWIDVYWLYQIGLALLYRAGGATALVLLKATAGAVIVGLSMLGRRPGHRAWPLALAWLPGLLMVSGRLSERPEAASLVLLTAYLVLLARASRAPRGLWLLPILQVLWVNCHGFFVLGPLVLLAYAAEWVIERLRPPGVSTDRPADFAADRPPARTFVAVSLLSLLACVINPYGAKALTLPIEQFHKLGGTAGVYRATIGELKTAGDFIAVAGVWNPYLLAYFATLLGGLVSFVVCARRARVHLFRGVIFTAGAYLAWQGTRNNALFGVIAVLVTTWNFDDALAARPPAASAPAKTSRRRALAGKGPKPSRVRGWPGPNAALLVAVGALAWATVSGALYAWSGEGRRVGLGERPRWFAHDACAFLARPDLPERIVAFNISQAAVCIAHSAPRHKQFMDPRLEVNTQETFERYLAAIRRLWHNDLSWENALGIDYGRPDEIPAILIERGTLGRAAEILSHDPRWRCVFADQMATVFVASRFAEQHHLPVVSLH